MVCAVGEITAYIHAPAADTTSTESGTYVTPLCPHGMCGRKGENGATVVDVISLRSTDVNRRGCIKQRRNVLHSDPQCMCYNLRQIQLGSPGDLCKNFNKSQYSCMYSV